jgi:hypothetical protein
MTSVQVYTPAVAAVDVVDCRCQYCCLSYYTLYCSVFLVKITYDDRAAIQKANSIGSQTLVRRWMKEKSSLSLLRVATRCNLGRAYDLSKKRSLACTDLLWRHTKQQLAKYTDADEAKDASNTITRQGRWRTKSGGLVKKTFSTQRRSSKREKRGV